MLDARRRHLARHGWPMALRRQTGVDPVTHAAVTVQGFKHDYSPGQIVGGILQGDARVEITPDEIAAAAWPGPPRKGDSMLIDQQVWAVQGATAVRAAGVLVGYSIWIRGGR